MTPAPHVVVCPFIDPGGAGTVQNSYRILDLFRGSARARSSLGAYPWICATLCASPPEQDKS